MIRTLRDVYLDTGYGYATEEMAAAADQTKDGVITIDSVGTFVPAERLGDPDLFPPLHEVRVQTIAEAQQYDELAARLRAALVKVLRSTGNPTIARRLAKVTFMDPEHDGLAWRIRDMADPSAVGITHQAAAVLPEVWERSYDVAELTAMVDEIERLYPADSTQEG